MSIAVAGEGPTVAKNQPMFLNSNCHQGLFFFFIASLTTTLQLKVWRPIYSLHILVQSAPLRNRNGGGCGRHTMEGRTGQECNDSEDPWSEEAADV